MISWIRNNSVASIFIIGAILFGTFASIVIFGTETVEVRGTVLEHNVTSDRQGKRIYTTLVNCEDGYIREETGLNYYVVPVGNTVTVKKVEWKIFK